MVLVLVGAWLRKMCVVVIERTRSGVADQKVECNSVLFVEYFTPLFKKFNYLSLYVGSGSEHSVHYRKWN